MIKTSVLTQEDFDALLKWFSPNREEAGGKYEKIREGLIRYFHFRGCADPQILADETINRVALKLSTFDFSGNAKTISFFYGFASKIYLEYVSQFNRREVQIDAELQFGAKSLESFDDVENEGFKCLEKCLAELPSPESDLVIRYYSEEKKAKLELRRELAKKMNIQPSILHTRVHRIRIVLKDCVENCLNKK